MSELEIFNLYEKSDETKTNEFINKIDSTMRVQTDFQDTIKDTEWIEKMNEVVPHLDSILRNPNRFIINEEEIVKIELARKITVDSIKHLSKHTNFIQEIDKKTGDVRPSKILNINKEESYDTYENRLIYSLIQNMKIYISRKKKTLEESMAGGRRNNKKIEYKGSSKIDNENVNINILLDSDLDSRASKTDNNGKKILEQIEELENKMIDLSSSEVYRILDKIHFSLVTSPIKKTNVILKNVHFQYAVKMWNYLQTNYQDTTKTVKDKKDYMDNGELKSLTDETFLLNYLVMSKLDKNKDKTENEPEKKELNETIINMMITRMVNLDSNISEQEIKDMIGQKFAVIKYKNQATIREIQQIFKNNIDKYLEKIR